MKNKIIIFLLLTFLAGLIFPLDFVFAEKLTKTVKFEIPDIKEKFCGSSIDYRVCKCAFHNEMCKDINREKRIAAYILNARFKAHVVGLRANFILACKNAGGRFSGDACGYYAREDKEKQCLPDDFETNWKKYSDIDERIPPNERSFEAKNVHEAGAKLKEVLAGIEILERDYEINNLMLNELRDYRKAVATNFKVNMLKSFWRLAWLTYDTSAGAAAPMRLGSQGTFLFQGGTDLGRSYAKLFIDDLAGVQHMAILAKLARESLGDNSKYNFNTKTLAGKFGSVSITALISFFENLDNPAEVAKEMFQDITKQALPDVAVKLSDEDVKLLAGHYNKTKLLDDALQEGSRVSAEIHFQLDRLKKDEGRLKSEFQEWEEKERERTQEALLNTCEK